MAEEDLSYMEKAMSLLNMNTPVSRFAGVFVATNALVYFLKPGYFFNTVTNEPDQNALVPWWALGFVTGGAAAFFL